MQNTGNYKLLKPDGNDYFDVAHQNTNMDRLDDAISPLSVVKSNKDANGIYTTVTYNRASGLKFMKSVLSGGTSPNYTTRTETYYDYDGTTVLMTKVFTITYDTDGTVVSEVLT